MFSTAKLTGPERCCWWVSAGRAGLDHIRPARAGPCQRGTGLGLAARELLRRVFVEHAGADHDELIFFDEVHVFAKGFGEHDGLGGAFEAFDAEGGHRFLLFAGVEFADVGDHATETGLFAVLEVVELIEVGEGAVLEGPLVAGEGVAG